MSDTVLMWGPSESGDEWYESLDELLNGDYEFSPGYTVYFGNKVDQDGTSYFNIDSMLESLSESAYEECGEFMGTWPDLSDDDKNELDELIKTWLRNTCPMHCYLVENIKPYVLTEADIADA